VSGQGPQSCDLGRDAHRDGPLVGTHVNSQGKEVDTWYSGKHWVFGANVQFLSAPDGTPLWVSDAEPGSTNDIVAAGEYCLSTRPRQWAATLADSG
jgi:hypothetical protein